MNFIKSGLQSVLGQPDPDLQVSGAETVERIVERVSSSTLLEDRRDACRALKSLSRKWRVEVGAQGMGALIQILEIDRADCLIIGYALDTLCNITSPEQFEEEMENPQVTVNIGEQFTEMFIKSPDNVTIVLNYLEEYDFRVRLSAIKLLTNLLANRVKEIQEVVLVSPMGVSKLMDLLIDSREVIRNDALLLLIELTRGNANIQKIVAFENAFDRLFDVIRDEGGCDGGIVVEDCLTLMQNLLKNNTSNQQFFKEGSYIQRLAPMFKLPAEIDELGMSPQKVANIHSMLQIVRSLVSPGNSQQVVAACQKTMRSSGLLEALCSILMSSGIPPDILTETINSVGDVIRGEIGNQEYFSSVMAPSNPPRPAIVVLIMSMVNEKQPLPLRCAVLYCFECFLYRNEVGQTSLVQTLLPSSTEVSSLTSGQLLCGGLFSTDSMSNWFSAVSLMHGLLENPEQKEQLLRVLLATSVGSSPISLLQQCSALLQQGNYKVQSKIGLLMLLSVWLSHCQLAAKNFLEANGSVSYLIAQIGANEHDENEYLIQGLCAFLMGICIQFNDNSLANNRREDLSQLLVKRIGIETFTTKLGEVSKHESYSRAAKQPQLRVKTAAELLLDYEFCKLFKALEGIIVKTVNGLSDGSENVNELTLSQEVNTQYKNIIRDQDVKLNQLRESLKQVESARELLHQQLQEAMAANAQLSDQNILLKAQLQAAMEAQQQQHYQHSHHNSYGGDHMANNVAALTITTDSRQHLEAKISFYENENTRLLTDNSQLRYCLNDAEVKLSADQTEIEKMRKDQEDLLELLADQDTKMSEYRRRLRELGQQMDGSDDEDDDDEDVPVVSTIETSEQNGGNRI